MDIVAHGLWAAAAARGSQKKLGRRISVGWTALWGVFPDLFAFTIPVTLALWYRLTGVGPPADAGPHGVPHMHLAGQLYRISHSLIIFAVVFGLVWLLARRPVLPMLGWALHILIDIPSHSMRFFPTPFLWPVSDYRFGGIGWANRWFMLANYTALAVVWFLLWRSARRARRAAAPASSYTGQGGSHRDQPE
ncbi:MAG: hypothetical protein ABSD27_12980 [Bryobacteraceae bacterium]|jgi:hypothetical protein